MLLVDGLTKERDAIVEVEEVLRLLLQGLRQTGVDGCRPFEASDVAVNQAVFVLHPQFCKTLGIHATVERPVRRLGVPEVLQLDIGFYGLGRDAVQVEIVKGREPVSMAAQESRIRPVERTLQVGKDVPSVIGHGRTGVSEYHLDLADAAVQGRGDCRAAVLKFVVEAAPAPLYEINHAIAELGHIPKFRFTGA